MRQFSTPPRSREISFADRYSIALLSPNSVNQASPEELRQLAENLYNDVYLMDQAACSSPQLFVWIGNDQDVALAQQKLWSELNLLAKAKYDLTGIKSMNKFVDTCDAAINYDDVKKVIFESPYLSRLQLTSLTYEQQKRRGYAGTIYEVSLANLDLLSEIIDERYQTLTYFGIEKRDITHFIKNNNLRGIDRVVPVGDALKMGPIWDGYNVITSLSRQIHIY